MFQVSRLLLLAGASPDYPSEHLHNAPILGVCAHQGHTEMVALFIEFGADVILSNNEGVTALGMASAQGHCDIVRLLVQAGASLTSKDKQNKTAMVQAAAAGHLNVVGYLLSCDWPGPSDLLRNQSHQSLVAAASNGHINVRIVLYVLIIHLKNLLSFDSESFSVYFFKFCLMTTLYTYCLERLLKLREK